MKFNITNQENKITFQFECDFDEEIVTHLFDAIRTSYVHESMTTKAPIVEEIPDPIKRTPRVRQTRERKQTEVETPTPEPIIDNQISMFSHDIGFAVESKIEVEEGVVLKMDIYTDSPEKMELDVSALKLMTSEDKLGAIKFVKEKTGLDLNTAKTYCDNLWNRHLQEK